MPLFTSLRDAGFLLGVNRELLHAFISTEVAVYKLDLNVTNVNIYEESENKVYKAPVRIFSLIRFDDKEVTNDDFGIDANRTMAAGFLKADLIKAEIYIEEGDIIQYDSNYYQIDKVSNSNYWAGRRPESILGVVENNWTPHGYDIAVVAECHLTRLTSIQIEEFRAGEVESPVKVSVSVPNFL